MSSKSIIAITMGDPCGIGPEVVAKALAIPEITAECHPLVIGNAPLLRKTASDLGLALDITPVSSASQASDNAISILDPGNLRPEGYYERRRENQLKAIAQVKSESDRMEGMQAFVEKREAAYTGPVKTEEAERLY